MNHAPALSVRQGLVYVSTAAVAWGTGGPAGALLHGAGQLSPVAVSFWRRVVANYTQGRYQERVTNGEVRQVFDSGNSRAASATK